MAQTLEDFLGTTTQSQDSSGSTLEEFLANANRPGALSRAATQAGARTADISHFLTTSPVAGLINPGGYLGRKAAEALGLNTQSETEQQLQSQRVALPQAQGFKEKAADIVGAAAPDVAMGIATGGAFVGAGGLGESLLPNAGRLAQLAAGETAHSLAYAPIEFGTRDPASAAINTVAAPVLGTAVGYGLGKLAGRLAGRAGAAAEATPETFPLGKPPAVEAPPAVHTTYEDVIGGRVLSYETLRSQLGEPSFLDEATYATPRATGSPPMELGGPNLPPREPTYPLGTPPPSAPSAGPVRTTYEDIIRAREAALAEPPPAPYTPSPPFQGAPVSDQALAQAVEQSPFNTGLEAAQTASPESLKAWKALQAGKPLEMFTGTSEENARQIASRGFRESSLKVQQAEGISRSLMKSSVFKKLPRRIQDDILGGTSLEDYGTSAALRKGVFVTSDPEIAARYTQGSEIASEVRRNASLIQDALNAGASPKQLVQTAVAANRNTVEAAREFLWMNGVSPTPLPPIPGKVLSVGVDLPEETRQLLLARLAEGHDIKALMREFSIEPSKVNLSEVATPSQVESIAKRGRSYYVTADGKVHTNKTPGATRVYATTRTEARALAAQVGNAVEQRVQHMVGLGVPEAQARKVLTDPRMNENLAKAFEKKGQPELAAQLRTLLRSTQIHQAAIEGRAVPTKDILEVGDEAAKQQAEGSLRALLDASVQATKGGDAAATLEDITRVGQSLPPAANKAAADAIEGLPGEAGEKMVKSLKGRGGCPI